MLNKKVGKSKKSEKMKNVKRKYEMRKGAFKGFWFMVIGSYEQKGWNRLPKLACFSILSFIFLGISGTFLCEIIFVRSISSAELKFIDVVLHEKILKEETIIREQSKVE